MPLGAQARLEAELGVTADDLGLSDAQYVSRVQAWQTLAEETQPDELRRYFTVKAYLLRTWITALTRKADKFRAEGDVTVERNMMARVALLKADLDVALALTLSPEPTSDPADAAFGPLIGEWGVGP
ncbi:hypothetical protein GCM10022631_01770 [Deinococcus rubellus]|uniref:Uncharacterized protein n=1 Tax=Deinococcus rubellus TaxID=1889240 RepID=A0ABY5YI15_9DEIO|nr:hypothetical protein [Deinococcus rubellus]UWX64758.1 hypothetical protein N0D28_03605 [Deinococcus rubellus]